MPTTPARSRKCGCASVVTPGSGVSSMYTAAAKPIMARGAILWNWPVEVVGAGVFCLLLWLALVRLLNVHHRARATVIVLTNLPGRHREYRATNLARLGLNFPLVINIGRKGPAMRALAEGVGAPVFFLDDSPRHIESVAETAPDVVCLHFVGDERLAAIVEPAPQSHHRTDDWRSARAIIESRLADDGF